MAPLELRDKHGRVLRLSDAPGHRVTTDWMGTAVLTFEDLLRPGLRAVTVGINPASVSVARGHYYQGILGQRFLARLREAGVIRGTADGYEDDAAFAAGVGFTDAIKRPTANAKGLTASEYAFGKELLVGKLERYRPDLLIFTFKNAATKVLGSFEGNGFVPGLRLGPSKVFVMPGPYESRDTVQATLAALAARVGVRG